MSFAFDSYLKKLDPTSIYRITPLVGGVVNLTVRATIIKQQGIESCSGLFPGHPSIILKHAPPYVAAVGPEAIMSQNRQITEAKALSLFDYNGPLHWVSHESGVEVPRVLYHDPDSHVLVMTDLGSLPNLSDIFAALGGYTPDRAPASIVTIQDRPSGTTPHSSSSEKRYYEQTGTALGSFFARLHSPRSLESVVEVCASEPQTFTNESLYQSVYEYAIKPLKSHLELFVDLIPSPHTAESLYTRIESDWLRPTTAEERSFILGDCWTGAVLVSPPPSPATSLQSSSPLSFSPASETRVGVIDWEFASQTRGPHGDIPQFLAHLELFHHAARWHKSHHHVTALNTLISSLVTAYRDQTLGFKPDKHDEIQRDMIKSTNDEFDNIIKTDSPRKPMMMSPLLAKKTRSALLSLASEMLNCMFWKVWPCCVDDVSNRDCHLFALKEDIIPVTVSETKRPRRPSFQTSPAPRPSPLNPQTEEKEEKRRKTHDIDTVHLCPLIRDMARSVIWLIIRAGEDEEEMCSNKNKENWVGLERDGPPGWFDYNFDSHSRCDQEEEDEEERDKGRSSSEAGRGKTEEAKNMTMRIDRKRRKWLLDLFV